MLEFIKTFEEFSKKVNHFIIKVERDFSVAPKYFEGSKYLSFYVRIFIDVDSAKTSPKSNAIFYTLDDIKLVRYQLDPSYIKPLRTSEDRTRNFEIKVWTYGFYPIKATILTKFADLLTVDGEVRFLVTEEEKKMNKGELG